MAAPEWANVSAHVPKNEADEHIAAGRHASRHR